MAEMGGPQLQFKSVSRFKVGVCIIPALLMRPSILLKRDFTSSAAARIGRHVREVQGDGRRRAAPLFLQ